MLRHSLEEVKGRVAKDLDACCVLLEESGAYLSGSTPCQADCFLFGVLDSVRLARVAIVSPEQRLHGIPAAAWHRTLTRSSGCLY